MKTLNSMLFTALLGLGAAACSEPESAAAGIVPRRPGPAAPAAPVEAAVAAAAEPAYVYGYNPVAKRDPFRSPLEDQAAHAAEVSNTACSEPLCQFDLEQLKLVAVVTGDANPIAMVEDPDGRGHVLRRNARIGKKGGKVTQILRESVTVTEYFPGNDGKVVSAPSSLQLQPEEARDPAYNLMTGKNYGE